MADSQRCFKVPGSPARGSSAAMCRCPPADKEAEKDGGRLFGARKGICSAERKEGGKNITSQDAEKHSFGVQVFLSNTESHGCYSPPPHFCKQSQHRWVGVT